MPCSAQETARESKTKSLISKLNSIIMPKYEAYRTRRVPMLVNPPTTSDSNYAAYMPTYTYEASRARLDMLRDLMRLEMPDHWIDVTTPPQQFMYSPPFATGMNTVGPIPRPAASQAYLNAYNSVATPPSNTYEGAECLYLIVTLGVTDNLGQRELFSQSNVGDTDNDGFKEFLDGWGRPISFLRWPAGFPSELGRQATGSVASGSATSITANGNLSTVTGAYNGCSVLFTSGQLAGQAATIGSYTAGSQNFHFLQTLANSPATGDTFNVMDPDPFDPKHIYPTGMMPNGNQPSSPPPQTWATFSVFPLIYSYGSDGIPDIITTPYSVGTNSTGPNSYNNCDPFYPEYTISTGGQAMLGTPQDLANLSDPPNGMDNSKDNIHNHLIGTR